MLPTLRPEAYIWPSPEGIDSEQRQAPHENSLNVRIKKLLHRIRGPEPQGQTGNYGDVAAKQ